MMKVRERLTKTHCLAAALLVAGCLPGTTRKALAEVQETPVTVSETADPQAKDTLFDGLGLEKLAAKAKESNEVSMDKGMLGLAGGHGKGLPGKMDLVNVRNYEFEKEGAYSLADLEVLQKRLEGNGWSHIVRNRTKTEVNDICVRSDNEGQIHEMVIINAEPKELNLVHLIGKLNASDLKHFGADMGSLGIDGDKDGDEGASASATAGKDPKLKHRN